MNQISELFDKNEVAIWRQTHDLVLALINLKAEIACDGAVEEPERMREVNLLKSVDLRPMTVAVRRRRPIADSICSKNGRFFETGKVIRTGRMG